MKVAKRYDVEMNNKCLTDKKISFWLFMYIAILYAVVYMTKNCFSAAMADIVAEGVMTKTQTGLITAMFYIAYAPLQVMGGRLADKWKPDKLILIGLIGGIISNLIIYFNQNYILMLVVWTLNACSQAALWPAMFKIISSELAREHRVRAVYYMSFIATFGLCFSFIVAAFVKRWQDNFLFSSLLLLVFTVGFVIFYPYAEKKMVPDADVEINTPSGTVKEGFDSRTMFKKCGLYVLFVVLIIRGLVELGIKNIAPTLLMESYDSVTASVGNLLNIIIILSGLIGMVAARIIFAKYVRDVMKGMLLFMSVLIPTIGVTCLVGKIDIMFIIASLSLSIIMASGAGIFSSYYSMSFSKYGKNGEVAGIVNSASAVGIVIQSYGVTLVADIFGWTAVYILLTVLCAISVALLCIIYPKWKSFVREYNM